MSIHRITDVNKGKDETYRQSYYKRLERAKAEIEKSFSDIYDISKASAELNRYAAEFDMSSFGEINIELNKVVRSLSYDNIKTSDVVNEYPSDDMIKLSKLHKK